MRTAVIGAGASGLSLSLFLDGDVTVFESADRPGGHCESTQSDGWTFDNGPHIMFSRVPEILDFMVRSLRGNVGRARRNNVVCVGDRIVRYPIENDLGSLPPEIRDRCLSDFLSSIGQGSAEQANNLEEWFIGSFGEGLTDLYFRPYNEKVWNVALPELSMSWSERIPQPPVDDVVKGARGHRTEGYVHQLDFYYPLVGGYEAIPAAWADLLPRGSLRLGTPVRRLAATEGATRIETPDGAETFDRVISTVPIPTLLSLVDQVPDVVRAAADALQYNPVVAVTLGFQGIDSNRFTAAYFPDPGFLVNRASWPCVFSPRNGPEGCFSVQSEITTPPRGEVLGWRDQDLITHVMEGLKRHGVLEPDLPLVLSSVRRLDYGYVVYKVDYQRHVETVRAWAASRGIWLHGRFGAFDYLNVDGCVMRSLELAGQLNGRPTFLDEVELGEPPERA